MFRDKSRLVAVGGSRNREVTTSIRIVGVPRLSSSTRHRRRRLALFAMDAEYAEFAASALRKDNVIASFKTFFNL